MFYRKKLPQSKDLNNHHQAVSWIHKLIYHWLKNVHRFDKEDDEIISKKVTLKKYKESDLFYNNILNFNKY